MRLARQIETLALRVDLGSCIVLEDAEVLWICIRTYYGVRIQYSACTYGVLDLRIPYTYSVLRTRRA